MSGRLGGRLPVEEERERMREREDVRESETEREKEGEEVCMLKREGLGMIGAENRFGMCVRG